MASGLVGATPTSTANAATGSSLVSGAGAFGKLKSEDFIKVMISELSHQDPFQPQDSSKLLEQFSSLRNIESQLDLQSQLGNLVLQNQISNAGGLIGKTVKGLDDSNASVQGVVSSVRVTDGKAVLELDSGKTLSMDRVTEIAPKAAA
jgi:flagellar basal-body rod modification protein FlgD